MFDFRAFKLNENDGLLGPEKIGHDPEYFQVELFDLIPGKNRVSVALHSRLNLIERQEIGGLGLREWREPGQQPTAEKQSGEGQARAEACKLLRNNESREHGLAIIPAAVRGRNRTTVTENVELPA